jgi:hypothetical protein
MSAILTDCCCDPPDPDPLSCCDCLNSSYSLSSEISWTSTCFDSSGGFGTVDVLMSYSGFVVTAGPCETVVTDPPGQNKYVPYSSTSDTLTGADISLDFSPTPPDALTCVDRSVTGATLDTSPDSTAISFFCATPYNLQCEHFRKADDSVVFRWRHGLKFATTSTCSGGLTTQFKGCIIATSPEQTTCHAPPSTGWAVDSARIYYCNDIAGACSAVNYTSSTQSSSQAFDLVVT